MKHTHLASIFTIVLLVISGSAVAHGDEDHSQNKQSPVAAKPPPGTGSGASVAETIPAQRLADGSLFVPKAVQRQLGLRTLLAEVKDLAVTVEFNGKIIADPNFSGRVQASQPGRIEPGTKGLPTLGQKVLKGQVLAWLRPVASSIERGNQQAQFAELESQLAIAERKVQRYAQLEGTVPQAAIDAARFELEASKKRRAAVGASINVPEALVAPVSGIVSATNAVLGQVVEAKEILFEVVDPARLAVEALAYDPALTIGIASASVALPGGALELQFVGAGRQLREQAIPLLFRVKSQNVPVAVGQPVKVITKTSRTSKGAAMPQAALIKSGAGETAVWIHTEAERFVLRKVSYQTLDATTVALTSGVVNDERVVTEGAGLLAQVR